jgi:hypothetical protein
MSRWGGFFSKAKHLETPAAGATEGSDIFKKIVKSLETGPREATEHGFLQVWPVWGATGFLSLKTS